MGSKTKRWIVMAGLLMGLGCLLFIGVMISMKWDFTKLSTVKYETNPYAVTDAYTHLQIETATADVVFAPSEDGTTAVVCHEQANLKHTVSVKDGTLVIEVNDTRKWYEHIGIHFGSPKITVYLPENEYGNVTIQGSTGDVDIPRNFTFADVNISVSTGDVTARASATGTMSIRASTGDIHVENVSVANMDLAVSTGKITMAGIACTGDVSVRVSTGRTELADVQCGNLISDGSTGNLTLKRVVASQRLTLERTTGNVLLESCDAAEISIQTDTGDVMGSLTTEKVFIAQTDTGRVDVPKTISGGRCEITTDTGDIVITVQ